MKSYAPTLEANGDLESLLGEVIAEDQSPAWKGGNQNLETVNLFETLLPEDLEFERAFSHEFADIGELDSDVLNEG